jgi:acyl-CoA thioester hydrolase
VTDDRFQFAAQVRWSDPDQMGHINHTRYLTYFEDARLAFVASGPKREGGHAYIAARITVDYLYPVKFRQGLTLDVHQWVGRIGTTSFTLLGELLDGAQQVARSEVILVAYSYPDDAKRPLTDEEREFLSRYVAR